MPSDEDGSRESLLNAGQQVRRKIGRVWDNFTDFALRDNVLEVAVGLIIAAAFTAVVKSFVSDILTPILGLLPFIQRNLDEKFAVLRKGSEYEHGYNTMKQALEDGAVIMAYGSFISQVINFFSIGLTLYAIANLYQWASNDKVIKRQVRCPMCRKYISEKAKRCVNCTSWTDGRDG